MNADNLVRLWAASRVRAASAWRLSNAGYRDPYGITKFDTTLDAEHVTSVEYDHSEEVRYSEYTVEPGYTNLLIRWVRPGFEHDLGYGELSIDLDELPAILNEIAALALTSQP